MSVAILLPTYKRAERLRRVYDNIESVTASPHCTYFVVESSDQASIDAAGGLIKCGCANVSMMVVDFMSASKAFNYAYRNTFECVFYLGCDDLEWQEGWLTEGMESFINDDKTMVVATDNCRNGGASGYLVRRKYIAEQSGVYDEPNVLFSSEYKHYGADSEFELVAIKRGVYLHNPNSKVKNFHYHYSDKYKRDETYAKNEGCLKEDTEVYLRRQALFKF